MNISKLYDDRCWQTWDISGAIGTVTSALEQELATANEQLLRILEERANEYVVSLLPPEQRMPALIIVPAPDYSGVLNIVAELHRVYRTSILLL